MADRTKSLGGSDAAAAVGLSKWTTPLELYMQKIGEMPGPDESLPMKMGTALEPMILAECEKEIGRSIHNRQAVIVDRKFPWRHATIDGAVSPDEIVEAKSTSLDDLWGDDDEQIPMDVACQAQHNMAVAEAVTCYVPVLFLFSRKFLVYKVPRDQEMIDMLTDSEAEFWDGVQRRIPPEPVSESDLRLRWPRDDGTEVVAPPEIIANIAEYRSAKADEKALNARKSDARNAVLSYMGEAARLVDDSGRIVATYKKAKDGEKFDVGLFREKHPEMYQDFLRPTTGSRRFLPKEIK